MKRGWLLLFICWLWQASLPAIGTHDSERERLSAKDGLDGNEVSALLQDECGYLWIGTDRGLHRYDGYCLRKFRPDKERADRPVSGLAEGRGGSHLWVFYPQGETACIDLKQHRFVTFPEGETPTGFTRHHPGHLCLWQYGGGKGCRRIRFAGGKIVVENFPHTVTDIRSDQTGNDWLLTDKGLCLNGFETVLPQSADARHIAIYRNLCLTVGPGGITAYNASRRIVRQTPFPPNLTTALSSCTGQAVWGDRLLLFTPGRTYAYHIIDGTFTSPDTWQATSGRVIGEEAGCVTAEDNRGTLVCYKAGENVQRLKPYEDGRTEGHTPLAVRLDDGTEAVALCGKGLWLCDTEQGVAEKYPLPEGTDSITTLLTDRTGCLWAGSKGGGLLCLRFPSATRAADAEGTPQPPATTVTDISSGNRHFTPGETPLQLGYLRRHLTIHFSNFRYADIHSVRYQYYLQGIDTEWGAATAGHTAVYHRLPPGTYTFHVRSADSSDRWGAPSAYTFTITSPWWQQWPACLLGSLIIIGIVTILLRRRRKAIYIKGIKAAKTDEKLPDETPATAPIVPEAPSPHTEVQVVEAQPPAPHALSPRDQRFCDRLQAILTLNADDPTFTVDKLAEQMHLSRTRLYTRIREVMDCAPSELLRKARMDHAARLLLTTDLTVDEVRERCGIGNSNQFYARFKQQFGLTPHQYRTRRVQD